MNNHGSCYSNISHEQAALCPPGQAPKLCSLLKCTFNFLYVEKQALLPALTLLCCVRVAEQTLV